MSEQAIIIQGLNKSYKLYPGHMPMVLDQCGYYALRFWKKRPAFPVKKALSDITISINKGERIGIIGRNGAGKTTLLKIIGQMIAPSSGAVKISGTIQALMKLGGGFHPEITGAENVRNALLYNGLRGEALSNAYTDVVDYAELGEFIGQPLKNYSLGMAARLQFAVATAITPDILIIDEVLGAGDSYFAAKSVERMKKLTNSGCTLLLVSHSRGQIMEFCEKALWIDDGKIRAFGPVEEITAEYDAAVLRQNTDSEVIMPQSDDEYIPAPSHMERPDLQAAIMQTINAIYGPLEPSSELGISKVEPRSQQKKTNQFSTGMPMQIDVLLDNVQEQEGLSCDLLFFDGQGSYLAKASSDPLQPHIGGRIMVDLKDCQLGYRDYLLAIILKNGNKAVHYSGGNYIKVIETNDSDPPYMHYPAQWYLGNNSTPEPSRMTGNQ